MPVVVFDVGRVLVDFCFEGFKDFLKHNGAKIESTQDFFLKTNIFEYEKGLVSCDDFFLSIGKLLKAPRHRDELEEKWRGIFTPKPAMLTLLKETAETNKTYLLSNTNKSHWSYLEEKFRLSSQVDGLMTSFEANSMKPDNKIYQALVSKHSLEPNDIIFIDDLEENIKAAEKLGWKGIHHVSAEKTKKTLKTLTTQ